MKDSGFAGSLIVAGAILIAGTEIANGFFGMFLGIALICWGIIERVVTILGSAYYNGDLMRLTAQYKNKGTAPAALFCRIFMFPEKALDKSPKTDYNKRCVSFRTLNFVLWELCNDRTEKKSA